MLRMDTARSEHNVNSGSMRRACLAVLRSLGLRVGYLFATIVWPAGCERDIARVLPGPGRVPAQVEPTVAAKNSIGGPAPTDDQSDTQETWDVIYLSGQPVGYQSLTLRRVADAGAVFLDAVSESRLTVKRFGETITEDFKIACRESATGEILRVEMSQRSHGNNVRTVGRRVGNELQFEPRDDGTAGWSLPIPESCGGFFAVEWSLRRAPLRPGESRQLRSLVPLLNQVAEISLRAVGKRSTALLTGPRELYCVQQDMRVGSMGSLPLQSLIWLDERGELLKMEILSLDQVSYRVDRKTALVATQSSSAFDLGKLATVPVRHAIPNAHHTHQVKYRVRLDRADPSEVFPATASQTVRRIDDHVAEITVRAIRPGMSHDETDSPPILADRTASSLIQSDDEVVRELSRQVHSNASDAWSLACAIETFVHERIVTKDYSTSFASASEVARRLQGDCTEHAVLMAAICRACDLPARVLMGLVYVEANQSFVFHMWNEVWIDDRWIPLDSTLALNGTGAAHLIVARGDLADSNGLSALLPVAAVLGQVSIDVINESSTDR